MTFKPEHARVLVSDLHIEDILNNIDYNLERIYGTLRLEAYKMLLEYSKSDDGEG